LTLPPAGHILRRVFPLHLTRQDKKLKKSDYITKCRETVHFKIPIKRIYTQ